MTITNATKVAPRDQNDDVPDNIDPAARPTRRILSVEEKLDLLARYEACEPGTKGAFARREGVYSSQLTERRRARHAGTLGVKRSCELLGRVRSTFYRHQQPAVINAYEANPIRFRRLAPSASAIPEMVWINPPELEVAAHS